MRNNEYFIMYSCCKVTKGLQRSVIIDLQKEKFYFIPNAMALMLYELNVEPYLIFVKSLKEEEKSIVEEYVSFLIKHDIGFFGNKSDMNSLPKIEMTNYDSSVISNAIFDFDNIHYLRKEIVNDLDELGTKALQLRYYNPKIVLHLESDLNLFNRSIIRHIDLVIPYFDGIQEYLVKTCQKHDRLSFITVFSSPYNKFVADINNSFSKIVFTTEDIINEKKCGIISDLYFSCNLKTYTESILRNTCLYQKISIDKNAYIKNCPSMKTNYGNISNRSLKDVINDDGFTDYWNITKEKIIKCKDCEFRNICTDCRAYIEDPEDIYSAPLKCGYDPNTCKWESWSTNPLKQKAIKFYDFAI